MSQFTFLRVGVAMTMLAFAAATQAADEDPCTRFTWDVTKELAVMKQTPEAVSASVKPGADVLKLTPDKLYDLKLSEQSAVTFAAKPGKPTLPDGTHGGLAQFRVSKAGKYRVAMTTGHWIDVVDGT